MVQAGVQLSGMHSSRQSLTDPGAVASRYLSSHLERGKAWKKMSGKMLWTSLEIGSSSSDDGLSKSKLHFFLKGLSYISQAFLNAKFYQLNYV